MSTRKRTKGRKEKDLLMLSNSDDSSFDEKSEAGGRTQTSELYSKLMKHPAFLFSMQPRMIADGQSDASSDEDQNDEDLKMSALVQAGSFMAKSDGEPQQTEPDT